MSDNNDDLPDGGVTPYTSDTAQLSHLDEHEQEEFDYTDRVIEVDKTKVLQVMEKANEDGTLRKVLKARKSSFVSHIIHLDGKKFDFTGRDYLKPLYDSPDKQVLLKTARQVEKTTFLGNNLAINSVIRPYNKALYVSPSHTQTRQFSNEKLKPAIEGSPHIKRYFQDSSVSMQVFEKGFTNGSYIFLRSAFRTADRTRGISARDLCLDELQDFYISEIPVIMECTSHFEDASIMMAGTPKSLDNPIEVYWKETTQCEWLVKCTRCNHWNFLDEKNIAPTEKYTSGQLPPGPVCKKCDNPLQVSTGQWFAFSKGKLITGYRIPQLMVPWIISTYDQWIKLLWKRDNYPFGQFANEVLGISHDNASKPITRDQLIECCDPDHTLLPDHPNHRQIEIARQHVLVAGVDWGEGNDGSELGPTGKKRNASYTVLTIGYYVDQRVFKYIYVKKFTGKETDPEHVVREVTRICNLLQVKLVGVDWGHGWGVNNQLVRLLKPDRVVQFQYLPKQKERMKWDPIGFKYQLLRNLIISEYFHSLKHGEIQFPKWSEFEVFSKDILAVYTEYSEYTREMKYDHRQSDPDDFLHSAIYCRMAGDIALGRKYGSPNLEATWGHRR